MLFLLPTDTCYGLAGAFTREDYALIYEAKGRDFDKPLAFLVRDFDDMDTYIEITPEQKEFLKNYPHPWSFLGKRKSSFILPDFLDARYDLISLRVASQCIGAKFRDSIEYPLFLTSANLQGEKESQTLAQAKQIFPWLDGYDDGICANPPSDIFSLDENGELHYLRQNYWKTPSI